MLSEFQSVKIWTLPEAPVTWFSNNMFLNKALNAQKYTMAEENLKFAFKPPLQNF